MKTTDKFTGKAEIYVKYRPGYPAEYIDYLTGYNALAPGAAVADIGAGTGKFTRQLLERNFNVIAVEPNDDMRSTAVKSLRHYPNFASQNGSAENTGLQDESTDLITVAQAFHWFDKTKFRQECKRILKKESNVALVWNSRDLSSRLVAENAEICKRFCPQFKGFSGGIEETPEVFAQFFRNGRYDYQSFDNHLEYSLDDFIGRNLSASYAPKSTEPDYHKFIEAITELFNKYSEDDKIILPNITRSYIGKV